MVLREEKLVEDGGIVKQVLREGEGDLPSRGQEAEVHYVGTLESDGSQFDSSRDRGDPFKFVLGKGQVIKAWDEAVATMRRGELARVVATAPYAYGERGSPPRIPGGATLVFEIEMLDFHDKAKEFWQMNLEEKIEFATKHKESGNQLFRQGDLRGAVRMYERGAEALSRATGTEEKTAVAELRKVLELNQALMFSKLQQHPKALERALAARELAPGDIKVLFRVAEEHLFLSNLEEAAEVLRHGLSRDPENRNFLSLQARVQFRKAEFEERQQAMFKNLFKVLSEEERAKPSSEGEGQQQAAEEAVPMETEAAPGQ